MEAIGGVTGLIALILVIWYLGKPINAIVAGAGDIASEEFDKFKDERAIQTAKDYDRIGRQAQELAKKDGLVTRRAAKSFINELNKLEEI